ncbi:hypothetical protein AMTRI_Chr13g86390 [Amborella trichopoda]
MIPKLYTSTFTVIGKFLCHSGATYPLVFASPKSDILGVKLLSKSMFWGLMSQCIIWVSHSSCKYSTPLAMPREISTLCAQFGLVSGLNITFASDPLLMNW